MSKQTKSPGPRYTAQERAVMRKITGAPKDVRRRVCGALRALLERTPGEPDAGRKSPPAPTGTARARTKETRE